MKKFKRSPLAIACYVIAALLGVYFIYTAVTSVKTVVEYYESYGMSAGAGEVIAYVLQTGLTSLVSALLMCMAGFILEEVRKLNPANWTESDTADVVAAELDAAVTETEEIAKEVADEAAENLDAVEAEIDEAADDVVEFVEEKKAEVVEEVKTTMEAADAAAEEVDETLDAAAEKVDEVLDAVADKVDDKVDEILEKADEIGEKAVKSFDK